MFLQISLMQKEKDVTFSQLNKMSIRNVWICALDDMKKNMN